LRGTSGYVEERDRREGWGWQPPRMLSKTRDYLDHFARFKRKENVEAVERLLSAHKELAKFERAQLGMSPCLPHTWNGQDWQRCIGSLCCDTAEEAKTLVPSLQDKISDDDLQELLDEITKLMGYGNWGPEDKKLWYGVGSTGWALLHGMAWRGQIFHFKGVFESGAFISVQLRIELGGIELRLGQIRGVEWEWNGRKAKCRHALDTQASMPIKW
jgi:DNA-directed RNA polymerase subunit F